MPENRMRILVACGAGGGIAATFNAPITGVFFGVEIILRELSVDALFTVMLSAMLADAVAIPFLGSRPFLSGFPSGIALHHPRNYLLVAVLAVVAALIGLTFKTVVYKMEDLWDIAWKNRPEWARPAIGGIALGLVLLALPQMYGVGYPVMDKAIAGNYVLWFLIVLAAGKIIACSMTLGIGGSGGVFAPSLFIGVTSGMAFGEIADHLLGPGAGQPALYAVVAMGAVFTSAARAPLTSLASVVEMTGDFTLTLPVMLAVAIATATSRALSYGTIYTTKLLRRGQDIDRAAPWRAFGDLKATDVMHPFPRPLAVTAGPDRDGQRGPGPGPARRAGHLPGRPADGPRQRVPRPVTPPDHGLRPRRAARAVGRRPAGGGLDHRRERAGHCRPRDRRPPAPGRPAPGRPQGPPQAAAAGIRSDGESSRQEPPNPLPGYQVLEVTIEDGSPASGQALGAITWPPGSYPVSVLRNRTLQDAEPSLTLTPGDRINLLARAPQPSLPPLAHDMPYSDQDGQPPRIPGTH